MKVNLFKRDIIKLFGKRHYQIVQANECMETFYMVDFRSIGCNIINNFYDTIMIKKDIKLRMTNVNLTM